MINNLQGGGYENYLIWVVDQVFIIWIVFTRHTIIIWIVLTRHTTNMIRTISYFLLWLLILCVWFDLGIEGFCSRWRQFIQQLSWITGSISLGIFSFKDSRIQQGRMLGSTKGGFTTYWWATKGPPKFDPTSAMSRNLRVLLSTVEIEPNAVL